MPALKEWIRLGRFQTASLTAAGALLGCAIGSVVAGTHVWFDYVLVFIWGNGYHFFGFYQNNLCDLKYDRLDPSKQNFPLVSGAIPVRRAWAFWVVGFVVFYIMGAWLVLRHSATFWWGFFFLNSAVIWGILYNMYSKRTLWSRLAISPAFFGVPGVGYFAVGAEPYSLGVWYLAWYAFFLVWHNNTYMGGLKDLPSDPINLLRKWGSTAAPAKDARFADPNDPPYMWTFSRRVHIFAWGTRIICPILAWLWVLLHPMSPLPLLIFIAISAALLIEFYWVDRNGVRTRLRQNTYMAGSEILNYWVLVASLWPILGPWSLLFYLYPPVWLVVFNRLIWGTSFAPRV